jgi:site-specific DNA-methyltransferase (adenine-specific)
LSEEGVSVNIIHGDCLEVLPTLPADSFHAAVTDPPYHLTSIVKRFGAGNAAPAQHGTDGAFARASHGFMGKQWDGGDVAFRPETWAEVLRVLRPGAHMLAFGGTRGFHRMTCAIEDAGFEIGDCVCWLYGSGFPKSHDVSKGIDKAAGAEREIIGRTNRQVGPQGTRRVAGLCGSSTSRENPDNPGNLLTAPSTPEAAEWTGWGTALKPAWEPIILARKPLSERTVAANVLRWGTGALNIDACRIEAGAVDLGRNNSARTGGTSYVVQTTTMRVDNSGGLGRWPANVAHDGSEEVLAAFAQAGERTSGRPGTRRKPHKTVAMAGGLGLLGRQETGYGDSGSPARFFYSAKADKGDRLESKHPTVKPVDLMRWLCRLSTPPGGRILDPFAGSGTTGMAAMAEGFDATLIEREAEYVADIRRRIEHVSGDDTPLFGVGA